MSFEPNPSSVELQSPSGQELFELPPVFGTNTKILSEAFIILKTFIVSDNRKYINSFMPAWTEGIFEGSIPEDKLFLISRELVESEDGSSMFDYTSIEEEEVGITISTMTTDMTSAAADISYGSKEASRLLSLYGNAVVELQVNLDEEPLGPTAITTNSIKGDGLTFGSLSSLGPISQEGLTLNVVSDLEGQIIEQRQAVITDVGGVTTAAARRNMGVSDRIESEAGQEGRESGNVSITSGY